jgi:hypothetical protein
MCKSWTIAGILLWWIPGSLQINVENIKLIMYVYIYILSNVMFSTLICSNPGFRHNIMPTTVQLLQL